MGLVLRRAVALLVDDRPLAAAIAAWLLRGAGPPPRLPTAAGGAPRVAGSAAILIASINRHPRR